MRRNKMTHMALLTLSTISYYAEVAAAALNAKLEPCNTAFQGDGGVDIGPGSPAWEEWHRQKLAEGLVWVPGSWQPAWTVTRH